ncbi:hypothetical protein SVAN01_04682 [Stagonosporopsis vannaccii]|nr:hypothetical protein SVAN01_04682 [Stagonosporopsis vannaccii]
MRHLRQPLRPTPNSRPHNLAGNRVPYHLDPAVVLYAQTERSAFGTESLQARFGTSANAEQEGGKGDVAARRQVQGRYWDGVAATV